MSLFRWTSEVDVFLPELDAEHRGMFIAAEELYRMVSTGAPGEQVKERLHHVWQMVEAHLLHEERLMRQSGFQSYEWHRKQHDAVRRRAKETDGSDLAAVAALLEYVAGWIKDHTAVADRIMASHLRNWLRGRAA